MPNLSNHTNPQRPGSPDEALFSAALGDLAGIIDQEPASAIRSDDPVVNAASRVARFMGFPINPPQKTLDGTPRFRLRTLAQLSGFRTRTVLLRGAWWKHDNGPLMVFSETEEENPACLIPDSASSYLIIDPVSGDQRPLTPTDVERLSPEAVMFYKPFENKPIDFYDLCKMIWFENRRDGKTLLLMGALGGLIGMVTPIAIGLIFDDFIPEAARSRMGQIILILFSLVIAKAMFEVTRGFASVRMQGKTDNTLQSALWDRLLALPVPFFRQFTAGELASKSLSVNTIIQTISGVTINAVLSSIFSIFNLLLLFYYDMKMAFLAIGLTLITVTVTFGINYFKIRQQRESVKIENQQAGLLFQLISGIAKIRMTGAWKRAFAKWTTSFAEKKRLDFKIGAGENAIVTFNSVIPILSSMAIFSWMVFKVKGQVSTGQFLAFNAAFCSFQGALLSMIQALTVSLSVIPLYEGIKPILQELPEFDEHKAAPGKLTGSIDVSRLSFKYDQDGATILNQVSITANPGEFIAIVGSSGSGKSTLLRLLLGFETPNAGSIYYDDKDLDTLDVLEVRRQLGVVLQNGSLIQGSIMENIIGQSNLTINDAWDAARMAGIEEDIKEMPMGMHTVLPAGGGVLSGGQRQRLIIARALVKKPTILYFDEATSALDNKTQAEVSRGIEELDVTRIVIAHRLSTIEKADRIYVLDQGHLVQQGSCAALMAQPGIFAEMAKRQIS